MADHIYLNNTLVLTLETNVTISDASTFRIYYKKPNKSQGYWTGSISGTTAVTYTIPAGTLNKAGPWVVKAWVQYAGGATYQGDPAPFQVRRPWQAR